MARLFFVFLGGSFLVTGLLLFTGGNPLDAMSRTKDAPGQAQPVTAESYPAIGSAPVTFADVESIFANSCVACHSGPQAREELRLDSYEGALEWRERARIVPGNPEASELVRRIRGQARPSMPMNQPLLPAGQIELIETWIAQGARAADGTPAVLPIDARVRVHGYLDTFWSLDGLPLVVDGNTRIDDNPQPGSYIQVRGNIQEDGSVRAERIRGR